SGGVDSSVAAALLAKDYDVIGVTLKLFSNEDIKLDRRKTCCSLDDIQDARSVAAKLGIDYFVYNFGDRFRECVIDRFNAAYMRGETPNPCIDCNRFIKFDALLKRAQVLERDYVATGHYARREQDAQTGKFLLKKGLDSSKDQSYVLYSLTQEQLSHTLFPLGGFTKHEIRKIADGLGFVNADKPDSQDICFVPDGDYAGFIERYTGKNSPHGSFISENGDILGEHKGVIRYTVGQRKGLGIALGKHAYVLKKDPESNTVTLGDEDGLFYKYVTVSNLNFIPFDTLTDEMRVTAKLRYRHKEQPAVIRPCDNGTVIIEFDEPQRAPSPGQAAVFYSGETVVGGGTIVKGFN
ncbi:MAG TPA: tRNA 2-thiouridine(34) synthase MnmA, partial [Ruminococcaceae bacterium]|nr:tRNA 2-thiouridine(34) synthase MnmA [Oscillospiraceae bacterium]